MARKKVNPKHQPKAKLSHPERRQRRLKMAEHAAEYGVPEAAREFGVTTHTVHQALKEFGLVGLAHYIEAAGAGCTFFVLAELINTNDTCQEIGDRHGVSRQRVQQVAARAREAGIALHPKRKAGSGRRTAE